MSINMLVKIVKFNDMECFVSLFVGVHKSVWRVNYGQSSYS